MHRGHCLAFGEARLIDGAVVNALKDCVGEHPSAFARAMPQTASLIALQISPASAASALLSCSELTALAERGTDAWAISGRCLAQKARQDESMVPLLIPPATIAWAGPLLGRERPRAGRVLSRGENAARPSRLGVSAHAGYARSRGAGGTLVDSRQWPRLRPGAANSECHSADSEVRVPACFARRSCLERIASVRKRAPPIPSMAICRARVPFGPRSRCSCREQRMRQLSASRA